ncbi:MAG TPA: hypothetical protein PLQ13_04515 [Candidatus Krumholzibacteria bacterium]|nr:hypothetical protein [Candidatus Krumholzibacteria bacterium]
MDRSGTPFLLLMVLLPAVAAAALPGPQADPDSSADGCLLSQFGVLGRAAGDAMGGDVLVTCDLMTAMARGRWTPLLGLRATADSEAARLGLSVGVRRALGSTGRTWYAQGMVGFSVQPGESPDDATGPIGWFAGLELGRHEHLALAVTLEGLGDPGSFGVPYSGDGSTASGHPDQPVLCIGVKCGGRPGLLGAAGVVATTAAIGLRNLGEE